MVFQIRYLTLYLDPVQHEILGEHILNIRIDLSHRIDILHPDISVLHILTYFVSSPSAERAIFPRELK